MKLNFTFSSLPLSPIEKWFLQEPVSHFTMVFEPDQLLFQSNLMGVCIDWFPNFLKSNTVVYSIEVPMTQDAEEGVYQKSMQGYDGAGYAYGGYFYFAWRLILRKFFGQPLPPKNPWVAPGTFLCVGLAQALDVDGVPDWLRQAVRTIPDTEMITPYGLYQHLVKAVPA